MHIVECQFLIHFHSNHKMNFLIKNGIIEKLRAWLKIKVISPASTMLSCIISSTYCLWSHFHPLTLSLSLSLSLLLSLSLSLSLPPSHSLSFFFSLCFSCKPLFLLSPFSFSTSLYPSISLSPTLASFPFPPLFP